MSLMSAIAAAVLITTSCGRSDSATVGSPRVSDTTLAALPAENAPPATSPRVSGLWLDPDAISALPDSGPAWDNLIARADSVCGTPDLSDQEDGANVCVMAQALVFARSKQPHYRASVVAALQSIASSGSYDGRALALGRELAAYVIAADLIGLESYDPSLDGRFRSKLRELLTTRMQGGGVQSLIECHERRPNNWGTHCGASRVAVAAYLGDRRELDRAARVFKGYLGDRDAYAGFRYGDLSWQCDRRSPVGINPRGCTREGRPVDGVLPDDQRRGGKFGWPPPKENYVWEGLQGALAMAVILHRQGYDAFEWEDRALLRAVRWLHEQADFPAEGDDSWSPHIVNHFYGTSFPAPTPSSPGKNVGWTDWTHASRAR